MVCPTHKIHEIKCTQIKMISLYVITNGGWVGWRVGRLAGGLVGGWVDRQESLVPYCV